ncbi:hypothetical protein TNCV_1800651 [Trichonephila clavipes]|nr:hypothetical protein TNCV_1800651 [Trichonephila clavipes]
MSLTSKRYPISMNVLRDGPGPRPQWVPLLVLDSTLMGHLVQTVKERTKSRKLQLNKNSAAWSDSQEFTAALISSLSLKCFPPILCLRYQKRWKSLGKRPGLYGAWSKITQPKDSIKSRVARDSSNDSTQHVIPFFLVANQKFE